MKSEQPRNSIVAPYTRHAGALKALQGFNELIKALDKTIPDDGEYYGALCAEINKLFALGLSVRFTSERDFRDMAKGYAEGSLDDFIQDELWAMGRIVIIARGTQPTVEGNA